VKQQRVATMIGMSPMQMQGFSGGLMYVQQQGMQHVDGQATLQVQQHDHCMQHEANAYSRDQVRSPLPTRWNIPEGTMSPGPAEGRRSSLLNPQPRKPLPMLPGSPTSNTEEGQRELMELLGTCHQSRKDQTDQRSLSAVSTHCGQLASRPVSTTFDSRPESSISFFADEVARPVAMPFMPASWQGFRTPVPMAQTPVVAPATTTTPPPRTSSIEEPPSTPSQQCELAAETGTDVVGESSLKKIFCGGIPQDMPQNELYTAFTDICGPGTVKKAWVQKVKSEQKHGASGAAQNHRGFGFVIFNKSETVDRLLGSIGAAQFIDIRNGQHQIEVKPARSSS